MRSAVATEYLPGSSQYAGANPDNVDMEIQYAWNSDDRYYATVVKNQYRQMPLLLRLRSQAIVMWIVLSGFTLFLDLESRTKWVFLGFIAAFAYFFPPLVKRGIMLKYRLRPTFGAKTTFRMTDSEVVITGPGAGRFPWTVYDRAVHFSDGILLVRRAGIRWLPDAAVTEGTPADAIAVVRAHLPLRDLSS
jgi:hypothetical protein